jgi:hypothetical protein
VTRNSYHPQSSSASRFTAGAFGFLTFSQCGERPDRLGGAKPLGDNAFAAEFAGVLKENVAVALETSLSTMPG